MKRALRDGKVVFGPMVAEIRSPGIALFTLQIEHKDTIENLSELLAVPGIDTAFVGPADLSTSFGKPGQSDDPEIQNAVARVIEVSKANGVIPGIHTSSVEKARYWIDKGMKMIGFSTDIKLIQQICKASVEELHSAL